MPTALSRSREHDQLDSTKRDGQAYDLGLQVLSLAPDRAGPGAVLDLQAGLGRWRHRVVQLVQVTGVERVRVHAPADTRVRDRSVLGHRPASRRGERADCLDDIRQLGHVGDRLVDRRLLGGDGAAPCVEHDLAAVTALLRECAVQHAKAGRGIAAGDRVIVDVIPAEGVLGAEQSAEDDDPGDDEDPVLAGRDAGDLFEQKIHGSVPSAVADGTLIAPYARRPLRHHPPRVTDRDLCGWSDEEIARGCRPRRHPAWGAPRLNRCNR